MARGISLVKAKEIRRRYLAGQPKTRIAKELSISTTSVDKAINDENYGKLNVPVNAQDLYREIQIENSKITEIKKQMLEFVEEALDEAMKQNNKFLFIDKFKGMLDSLDRITRLNNESPTDISRNETIKVDVAQIMNQLKTPEDKKAYLRAQIESMKKAEPRKDG